MSRAEPWLFGAAAAAASGMFLIYVLSMSSSTAQPKVGKRRGTRGYGGSSDSGAVAAAVEKKRSGDVDEQIIQVDDLPPGLANSGNMCFFNAVLQALAAAPPFMCYLSNHPGADTHSVPLETHLEKMSSSETKFTRQTVSEALLETLAKLETRSGHRQKMHLMSSETGQINDTPYKPFSKRVVSATVVSRLIFHAAQTAGNKSVGAVFATVGGLQLQQDAQEMLHSLLEILQVEWRGADRPLSAFSLSWERPKPATPCPFSGLQGTSMVCQKCRIPRPTLTSKFSSVELTLAGVGSVGSSVPIEKLLCGFTANESLGGVECESCTYVERVRRLEDTVAFLHAALERPPPPPSDIAGIDERQELEREYEAATSDLNTVRLPTISRAAISSRSVATFDELITPVKHRTLRRLLFARLPPILNLHINRNSFNPQTGAALKINHPIDFPLVLDLHPFAAFGGGDHYCVGRPIKGQVGENANKGSGDSSDYLYDLCAVIIHHGSSVGSGHYTCLRRLDIHMHDNSNVRWAHMNDSSVEEVVTSGPRLAYEAFMLVYTARRSAR